MIYYELAYLSGIPQLAKYSEHTCFYPALILDLKKHNIRYTGQTTQRLEKRTSDHIRNMKYLKRYGAFEKGTQKAFYHIGWQ